jgi:hypothetical protein
MKIILNARQRLLLILWLVAVHSFLVGLALMFVPASLMPLLGFKIVVEKFFSVQAGVFHLVMVLVYSLAAIGLERFRGLILLAILAKFMATIFLFTYYFLIDSVWTVLFSGIGDGLMGIAILLAFLSYHKGEKQP